MKRMLPVAVLGLLVAIAPVAASAQPSESPRAEAAERYDRALRLVDAGDLSGGLAEFQRAYALAASPVVSFNLGLVYAALHRPVEAARALGKALEAPQALRPEELSRARSAWSAAMEQIGKVEVSANVKEGSVEIDNVEVAKLPLSAPLDVAAGAHVIGIVSPGHAPARREVVVAGHEKVDVHLDLVTIEGLLAHVAVQSLVPAADVLVDGERVGKTPLESTVTVAPGTHQVEVRRAGYVPVIRSITLQDGARADLSMNPGIDPTTLEREGGWIAVTASENQAVVTIDGVEAGLLVGQFRVPRGPHRVHVERGGFLPADRDVEVPYARVVSTKVTFEPTPETRAHYVAGAEARRTWSLVTIGAGVALAAGGVLLAMVEQNQLPGARASRDAASASMVRFSGSPCDPSKNLSDAQSAACAGAVNDANDTINNLELGRTVGWVAAGVGGAALATGLVLLVTGDAPGKYDQKPIEPRLESLRIVPSVGFRTFALAAEVGF
jgi:hypothetical protein